MDRHHIVQMGHMEMAGSWPLTSVQVPYWGNKIQERTAARHRGQGDSCGIRLAGVRRSLDNAGDGSPRNHWLGGETISMSRRLWPRLVLLLLLAIFHLAVARHSLADEPSPSDFYRTAASILALSPEQTALEHPALVRGVI